MRLEEDDLGAPTASDTVLTPRPLEEVEGVTNRIMASDGYSNEATGEESYFDSSMLPTHTAYLGKTAVLTCIVHAAKSDKSVSQHCLQNYHNRHTIIIILEEISRLDLQGGNK